MYRGLFRCYTTFRQGCPLAERRVPVANTNPQAIKAVNERFRTFADSAAQFMNRNRLVLDKINADGIDQLFVDDKEVVDDGSATDGRSRLSNEDIKRLLGAMQDCADFFAGRPDMVAVILRASVNPERL